MVVSPVTGTILVSIHKRVKKMEKRLKRIEQAVNALSKGEEEE